MLVLSREVDQKVKIGDDITVTIVGVFGNKVRLGFDAPREVPIHREEVFEAIRRESLNREIAAAGASAATASQPAG